MCREVGTFRFIDRMNWAVFSAFIKGSVFRFRAIMNFSQVCSALGAGFSAGTESPAFFCPRIFRDVAFSRHPLTSHMYFAVSIANFVARFSKMYRIVFFVPIVGILRVSRTAHFERSLETLICNPCGTVGRALDLAHPFNAESHAFGSAFVTSRLSLQGRGGDKRAGRARHIVW